MKNFILAIMCAPMLSGCAFFHNVFSTNEKAALIQEPQAIQEAARVIPPDPIPPFRRASAGPKGIVPCGTGAALNSACRRKGDEHIDVERRLMPTQAVTLNSMEDEEGGEP